MKFTENTEALILSKDKNITSILQKRLEKEPHATIIERKNSTGKWDKITVEKFHQEATMLAKRLIAFGLQPNERIAIMSKTRYEWTLIDFAALMAGLTVVPIYETSSQQQIKWILENSQAKIAIAENHSLQKEIVEASPQNRPKIFTIDYDDNSPTLTLEDMGESEHITHQMLEKRMANIGLDTPATIIYTSGTTGKPKGVLLTHGNFLKLALNTVKSMPEVFNGQGRALLFLPLAHVFARFIEIAVIAGSSVLGHSDMKTLNEDLKVFRPTYLLGVPRVFEKVYAGAEQSSAQEKARGYFNWASRVAIAYSRALDTEKGPGFWLKFQHVFADGLIYSKLKDKLGGRVQFAISGGGPLGERLGHFYRGLGLQVLEGYGLTETTAPITVNTPKDTRIGSVGKVTAGGKVMLAEDGEILLRGDSVFTGYFENGEATHEAFTKDGWFRTGDLGRLDEEGFLFITGRKKEIIVTAGGKNVAPAVLEDRVRAHALVSQCVVVGDGKPFIGALITLDVDGLPGWLIMHDKPKMGVSEALKDADIIAAIDAAVKRANEAVSNAEAIKKWEFLAEDFSIESGHLTPSLKVKRHVVLEDFADKISELYGG